MELICKVPSLNENANTVNKRYSEKSLFKKEIINKQFYIYRREAANDTLLVYNEIVVSDLS